MKRLAEGVDYYIEDGKLVFTAAYHLKRGFCCNSGCRHCPYSDEPLHIQLPAIITDPTKGSSGESDPT